MRDISGAESKLGTKSQNNGMISEEVLMIQAASSRNMT